MIELPSQLTDIGLVDELAGMLCRIFTNRRQSVHPGYRMNRKRYTLDNLWRRVANWVLDNDADPYELVSAVFAKYGNTPYPNVLLGRNLLSIYRSYLKKEGCTPSTTESYELGISLDAHLILIRQRVLGQTLEETLQKDGRSMSPCFIWSVASMQELPDIATLHAPTAKRVFICSTSCRTVYAKAFPKLFEASKDTSHEQ